MAQNFIACDREQELLLPPSLHERLPEEHLAPESPSASETPTPPIEVPVAA